MSLPVSLSVSLSVSMCLCLSTQTEDGGGDVAERQTEARQERDGEVEAQWHVSEDVREDEHLHRLANNDDAKASDAANLGRRHCAIRASSEHDRSIKRVCREHAESIIRDRASSERRGGSREKLFMSFGAARCGKMRRKKAAARCGEMRRKKRPRAVSRF